jgi:hypothetical protein
VSITITRMYACLYIPQSESITAHVLAQRERERESEIMGNITIEIEVQL